jgi:hypothetical protein
MRGATAGQHLPRSGTERVGTRAGQPNGGLRSFDRRLTRSNLRLYSSGWPLPGEKRRTVEVSRDYWMRVYTAEAMAALIRDPKFNPDKPGGIDMLARRAVIISKVVLDMVEANRAN